MLNIWLIPGQYEAHIRRPYPQE